MINTLVIGMGKVGVALADVLRRAHNVWMRDVASPPGLPERFDILNICYPWSTTFHSATRWYIEEYQPYLTIIHSTVPVGTIRSYGLHVVHSPINGRHSELFEALLRFPKVVGAQCREDYLVASQFLSACGINVFGFSSPEASEAAKLLCTLRYGLDITFEKQVHAFCEREGLPFAEVYTEWTHIYNEGYRLLAPDQFARPVITHEPGKIGGTCVVPNAEMTTWFPLARLLLHYNEGLND